MLGVFPYVGAVNNPNENVRTYMTMAIVERGTIRIDEMVKTFGWINDMAKVPQPDGSSAHFSVKAPATSLAGVPGYFAYTKIAALFGHHFPDHASSAVERAAWLRNATWACRLFAVQMPCYLFLIWFERYLRAFTRDRVLRMSAVAAACLGTNYLAYTHMFASHATFAIAAFCGFAMAERELRLSRGDAHARRASKALLCGLFVGWTVLLEYHALPVAIVLAIFGLVAFWRPTRLLAFAAGGLVNVAVMMLFQWRAFGNPLTPGHKMVDNARFAAEHHQGLFGILMPQLDRIFALAFDPGFGFFGTSPFMLLGLLAVPFVLLSTGKGAPRERRLRRWGTFVWMVAMAGLWAVNAGFIQWRAGWTVGPRYLGAAPPFFALGAVLVLERFAAGGPLRRACARGAAGGLALASVLSIGAVGLVYDTLPETIERPFAQFAVPMIRTATVPHHVGEWFGWSSAFPWYLALGGLLGAAIAAGLVYGIGELGPRCAAARVTAFAVALGVGLGPALSRPEDGTALFVLHPATHGIAAAWEPPGRDRISTLRDEAERYGARRPCYWYHLADLDRVLGQTGQATRDEARAGHAPRERCPGSWF
jgi:hypothetical protein